MKLSPKDKREMTPREVFLIYWGIAIGFALAVFEYFIII